MINAYGTYIRGLSHEANDTECQDYCAYRSFTAGGRELMVAGVADGVGSCSHSRYGAETAIKSSIDYIIGRLSRAGSLDRVDILAVIKDSFNTALDEIENVAERMQVISYSFCTTLTVAVYDGENLWFGHSGDSGLVALSANRECKMITTRFKGEASNEVFPLQSGEEKWMFEYAGSVTAFALMTDGLLDFMVKEERVGNAVYYPFFDLIFAERRAEGENESLLNEELRKYLSGRSIRDSDKVTDDISLVVVTNTETVDKSRITDWSEKKWDEMMEEDRRRVNEALYGKVNAAQPVGTQQDNNRYPDNTGAAFGNGGDTSVTQSVHSGTTGAPNGQSGGERTTDAVNGKSRNRARSFINRLLRKGVELTDEPAPPPAEANGTYRNPYLSKNRPNEAPAAHGVSSVTRQGNAGNNGESPKPFGSSFLADAAESCDRLYREASLEIDRIILGSESKPGDSEHNAANSTYSMIPNSPDFVYIDACSEAEGEAQSKTKLDGQTGYQASGKRNYPDLDGKQSMDNYSGEQPTARKPYSDEDN